jgi:hypothetical protein
LGDRDEFADWLEANVDSVFRSLREPRRRALLESGLMPADLRALLLSDGDTDHTSLVVGKTAARDGRITEDEAQQIIATCRGRKRLVLDESSTWDESFSQSIPEDIRGGVIIFPTRTSDGALCIDSVLQLDEVVLNDLPEVRLNDRPADPASEPRPLSELSPGQRCSAILPILLLSGDYPLVVDQPEENLDNRLIRQVIVNILASMKLRRQVILATHNPNLPVLGDVEQCVVLQASGRDLSTVVATGNLDSRAVARYVTEIMEGGREAFQYRQSIYQTHWKGSVEDTAN